MKQVRISAEFVRGAPLLNDVSVSSLFGCSSSFIAIYKSILKESKRKYTGRFEDPLQCETVLASLTFHNTHVVNFWISEVNKRRGCAFAQS